MLTDEAAAQAMIANARWAERLGWDRYVDAIAVLVSSPSTEPGSRELANAIAGFQESNALGIDGILGPDTWDAMQPKLAPAGSLTGIVPPDAPPVPTSFDEVIALYGDPRPLLEADGSITPENESLWQRQTLAKGTLPFAVPTDGGTKTTFYAHHKLVSSFEAVFAEIQRLGLQAMVKSWDGIYNFRKIRGSTSRISLHAFGAALDLNASTNPLGTSGDMPQQIVDVFAHFNFFWGGNFSGRTDPMHFQYARGY